MKAITFPGSGEIRHVELPDPEPGPGEVVVQMRMSGICGTDLHYLHETSDQRGDGIGIVPGHEACGVVVAVGKGVRKRRVGERVIGYHHVGCGLCHMCRAGVPAQCPDKRVAGRHFHGSDGEFELLPEHAVLPLPDDISDEEGVFLACNYSTAYSALMKANLSPGDWVAVFGQGGVGLCVTMIAVAIGLRVAAVELSASRLELSRRFGAEIAFDPRKEDAVETLRSWADGRGVQGVLECSGSSQAVDDGLKALAPLGTFIAVGAGSALAVETGSFRSPEQTIRGTAVYRLYEYEPMVNLLRRARLPLKEVVESVTTIEHADAAFETMATRDTGKILFRW